MKLKTIITATSAIVYLWLKKMNCTVFHLIHTAFLKIFFKSSCPLIISISIDSSILASLAVQGFIFQLCSFAAYLHLLHTHTFHGIPLIQHVFVMKNKVFTERPLHIPPYFPMYSSCIKIYPVHSSITLSSYTFSSKPYQYSLISLP